MLEADARFWILEMQKSQRLDSWFTRRSAFARINPDFIGVATRIQIQHQHGTSF
jgi:hypothetical protein